MVGIVGSGPSLCPVPPRKGAGFLPGHYPPINVPSDESEPLMVGVGGACLIPPGEVGGDDPACKEGHCFNSTAGAWLPM
jgi:hypothetical protein